MSCVCDCACVIVCVLVCGLCPLAQVTRQNPVEVLEQTDSRISLSVEQSAIFCSSSNIHKHKTCFKKTNKKTKPGNSVNEVFFKKKLPDICLQLELSLLKRTFFRRKACKETNSVTKFARNIAWCNVLYLLDIVCPKSAITD